MLQSFSLKPSHYCESKAMLKINVETAFWPEQSDTQNDMYVFVYSITITNPTDKPIQLVSRRWIITDGFGTAREIRGEGVIGVQPLIKSGESFEYSSTCPLNTPFGTMQGEYYCLDENGAQFIAIIPLFMLTAPNTVH